MKVHLVSFAAGLSEQSSVVDRFTEQAKSCDYIQTINIVTEGSGDIFSEFKSTFSDFIKDFPRGYGYWLWKPFILSKFLEKFPEEDVILYCDIGCELSSAGGEKFFKYIEKMKSAELLGFYTYTKQSEYYWCKKELLDFFNLPKNLLDDEQICATFFILRVGDFSKKFISEWFCISKSKNYIYLNDVVSKYQYREFIEHRHDQAIFSLLMKKYNLPVLAERSYFPPSLYYKNSYVYQYPIHSLRSKGKSFHIKNSMVQIKKSNFYEYVKYHIIFFKSRVLRKFGQVLNQVTL
jgi:hypothetical protein